jgi:hypothetical protein
VGRGDWKPVHPADLRPFDPRRNDSPTSLIYDNVPRSSLPNDAAAIKKSLARELFEVRLEKDRWQMRNSLFIPRELPLTDSEGRFEWVVSFMWADEREIHFASPDFSRQAIHRVRWDEANKLAEIELRPDRKVRARVIERPEDHPEGEIETSVWATSVPGVSTYYAEAIAGTGALMDPPRMISPTLGGSPDGREFR